MRGQRRSEFFDDESERSVPGLPLVADLGVQPAKRRIRLVQREALRAQAPVVRRMSGIAPNGDDLAILSPRQDAAADPAIAAGRGDFRSRLDSHEAVLDTRGVDRDLNRGVFDAASRDEAEMLLVDGRGDDQLGAEIADDAARQDVCARIY